MLSSITVIATAAAAIFLFGATSANLLQRSKASFARLHNEGWLAPACSIIALLMLLNGGLWVSSKLAWLVMGGTAITLALIGQLLSRPAALRIQWPFVLAGVLVCAASAFVWMRLFGSPYLWLLQGDGNDTLYFYGGSHWAAKHPLYVAQEVIESAWGLGNCRQGALVFGEGCDIYRNGVYSLMSAVPGLLLDVSPNEVRAAVSLCALCIYCGTVPQVYSFGELSLKGFRLSRWLVAAGLALAVATCTGMVGAMANGNIGTVAGSAAIAMLVLWAMTPCSGLTFKGSTPFPRTV